MPTSKQVTNFVINKVPTKAIFNKMKEQGLINDDEIYLVEEDDSSSTFVSYESQSLTDAQKAQARTNIGALSTTGSAASATKLATARTIRTNLASTSTASFNGTSNITPGVTGVLPVANGGTGGSTAATARSNIGIQYGTSAPTSTPTTGNGSLYFVPRTSVITPISEGGTGGATQDAARSNLGLPTQDNRVVIICNGTRLVSGSNITLTLDPNQAKKYSAIAILIGTPLGGNYGNMYDSFIFPMNPDTWAFRFFNYTSSGQDWQCAKANLSSDWKTFTITSVSGSTNNPCWCYLM